MKQKTNTYRRNRKETPLKNRVLTQIAISFLIGDIHPADLGTLLDRLGIAIRTGHHCAQPLIDHFSIPGTVRASFAMYNTVEEVDTFIAGINRVVKMFG